MLDPPIRWFPAGETLKSEGAAKHLPSLVSELRKKVNAWRDSGFELEFARLDQWCKDINKIQSSVTYRWLLVREEEFKKYTPKSFEERVNIFKK